MNMHGKKSDEAKEIGASLALGVSLGLIFGSAMGDPGAGLILGIGFGVGLGTYFQRRGSDRFD